VPRVDKHQSALTRGIFAVFALLSAASCVPTVTGHGVAGDPRRATSPLAFTDLAQIAGVTKGGDASAIAWLDFDGDGDQDLYVAGLGKNRLFRNDGAGQFARVKKSGLEGGALTFGVAVGDYDNDGRLDVFLANLGSPNVLLHNEGTRFANRTRSARVGGGPSNSYSAAWADYDGDGLLDLYVANGTQTSGAANYLYHNDGGGRFSEVGGEAGVRGADRSLGCAWGDFDGDGDPDLYVANFGEPNRLYRNDGDGTFTDVARSVGVDDTGHGAGAAWGDYDNDGRLDLYVFNTNAGTQANADADVDRLYRNLGGTFTDETRDAGLFAHEDGEAAVWADFDCDGWLDLFVANRSDFSRQRNRLFRNLGTGGFADVTSEAGVDGTGFAQPAAVADYDGDGRLDLAVGNLPGAPEELFHNVSPSGNFLVLRLVGRESNRAAIGARVVARTGDLRMTREVASSSGRSSQGQLAAHFGLGASESADLEIRWPSGLVQTLVGVPAGFLTVEEDAPAPSEAANVR
jgi:enediyne biosynthesis protein E4